MPFRLPLIASQIRHFRLEGELHPLRHHPLRVAQLEPPASQQLNFFVYPRVELDGVEHTGVKQSFSFVEVKT